MCGIFGYYKLNNKDANPRFKEAAFELMKHRGPDAKKFKEFSNIAGLGHLRLSIIDTRAVADQPMESSESIIIFNGEVYNYSELKTSLLGSSQFFSTSDTEVLQKGIEKYGVNFLSKTNGMFAFAFFNKQTKELILARDRFGVKPLHYMAQDGVLYFSSEIKPLISIKQNLRRNSKVYLSFIEDTATDYNEETFIEDIFQLKGGFYLSCTPEGFNVRQWYFGQDYIFDESIFQNRNKTLEQVENLLVDAIKIRLRSDVPLCMTLSGGLDSSTIYTLLKERLNKDITLFTYSHPGSPIDETDKVKRLAEKYGDKVIFLESDYKNGAEELEEALRFLEFPIWNPSALAYQGMYKKIAEQGFKVVIEGHGSDEQLGGYPFMVESAVLQSFKQGKWKNALAYLRIYRLMSWDASSNPANKELFIYLIKRFILSMYRKNVFSNFKNCVNDAFNHRILPIVLRTFDRLTMRSSLESRSPYMDYRLVEFFKKMPMDYKLSDLGSKAVLREILKKYGKDFIYKDKVKIGFASDLLRLFNNQESKNKFLFYSEAFKIPEFDNLKKQALKYLSLPKIGWQHSDAIWKVVSLSIIDKLYGLKK